MKTFSVEYDTKAKKKLEKLDAPVRNRIRAWIERNLVGCENPRRRGKPLEGRLSNYWRYRVGDYRLIADIQDDKIIILTVNVDKRNDIYK